jgi:thiol:disulfide interchange protein
MDTRIRYILVCILLAGCSSVPKPTPLPPAPVETKNQEKDKYITRVEDIISDSASALTAVVPNLDKGNVRGLVEAQVTRLSGVSKPSVVKVEEYTRIIKQNDSKAVEKDKNAASKVDEETDSLWQMVEQKDYELAEAHSRADAEFKQKILWQFSTAGLGLFVTGLLVVAFTPFKKSGAIVMGGGTLAMASLWIFDSQWFTYIAGGSIGIVAISLLAVLIKNLTSRTRQESCPQTQESSDPHSPQ